MIADAGTATAAAEDDDFGMINRLNSTSGPIDLCSAKIRLSCAVSHVGIGGKASSLVDLSFTAPLLPFPPCWMKVDDRGGSCGGAW